MPRITIAIAALALAVVARVAYADADIGAGKAKADACAGCHGANGEGVGSNQPLAGKSTEDFTKAIAEYKAGTRKNAAMKMFSSKLTPQDVENLAAYYASLKK
ncbi:MAG TPA: c-type cytochrome [Burkholderiales bacterium]|nr:c-type cytochrome [Burkholderiales bacterium]